MAGPLLGPTTANGPGSAVVGAGPPLRPTTSRVRTSSWWAVISRLLVELGVQQHPALLEQHRPVAVRGVEGAAREVPVHGQLLPTATGARTPSSSPTGTYGASSRVVARDPQRAAEVVVHAHLRAALATLGDLGGQPGASARYERRAAVGRGVGRVGARVRRGGGAAAVAARHPRSPRCVGVAQAADLAVLHDDAAVEDRARRLQRVHRDRADHGRAHHAQVQPGAPHGVPRSGVQRAVDHLQGGRGRAERDGGALRADRVRDDHARGWS